MIINNISHLRKSVNAFGEYKSTINFPDIVLQQIKSREGEIRTAVKEGIDYMVSNTLVGVSANQIHSKLPLIMMVTEKENLVMINPYLTWWQKKMLASVEEVDEIPGVRTIVPRSSSIRINYFTLRDNKFVKEESRFNSNESATAQRLLDLLSGVICFDKGLPESQAHYSKLPNEGLVYRIKSEQYKFDYFVDGINTLFFSGFTINPNDYKEKIAVGASNIKKTGDSKI